MGIPLQRFLVKMDCFLKIAFASLQFTQIKISQCVCRIKCNGSVEIIKSRKTGKIRNVYCDGKHVLSMRATDGLFTLKAKGAEILHEFFKMPELRVVIEEDAVPFVREGKNVFAKFVVDCDKELRPYDEALIVDGKDELIAVGQCRMNREEMLSFESGMAVKTREGIE